VSSAQIVVVLAAATAVFALWSAIFATRADRAARHANLGGTLAGCGLIVQSGDELYAGEVTLPEKAPARPISLPFVVKAWQRIAQPKPLLLVARDVSGRCWDCLDGGKQIKDPRKWVAGQLRDLRMQGMVDFPSVTGTPRR
jgi:hypothetical protein